MGTQAESRGTKLWPFLLQAAVLGAVLATLLSALSIAGTRALGAVLTKSLDFESAPTLWDVAKATLLLCTLTVVWWGPFGFLAGALGASVLHLRKATVRTFRRLLIESAGCGLLAALLFTLYDAAVNSWSLREIQYFGPPLHWFAISILCLGGSVVFAVAFRKLFVRNDST